MTREEQDKLWAELSEESKESILSHYNGDTSGIGSQFDERKKIYERIFGSHNLKRKPTFEDILEWSQVQDLTSLHEKFEAIGDLMLVAKFLNKNEDGSDWVPDWEDENEIKWCPCIYQNRVKSNYMRNINKSLVHFRTEEILNQAIDILGEETIRTALGNY